MESIEDESVSVAGTTCAFVTVLRALLDAQADQDAIWERLRSEYTRAASQYDADPSMAGERRSFEEVFDMLGLHVRESTLTSRDGDHRSSGSIAPGAAQAKLGDGVDDASMY